MSDLVNGVSEWNRESYMSACMYSYMYYTQLGCYQVQCRVLNHASSAVNHACARLVDAALESLASCI